jgi:hypothetical protein
MSLSKLLRIKIPIDFGAIRAQKKTPTNPNPTVKKAPKFLPLEKFNKEGGLLLYESKEGNFFKLMTIG